MSRTANSGEGEGSGRLDFARLVSLDRPVAESLQVVPRIPGPLKLLEPQLARVPAALPVVRAGVDEHPDSTLEQTRDVELRRNGVLVEALVESATDAGVAAAEVLWRFNA